MAAVTSHGSRIMAGLVGQPPTLADPGEGGGRVKVWVETLETGEDDSTGSTYHIARLPSNVRILGLSKISNDALGTSTATLDIGIFNTGSRPLFTNDADAINDGIVASSAGTNDLIKDRANWGKRLYEFINGVTADPKCDLDIKLTLADAHLNAAGTITVEIYYAYD